MDAMRQQMGMAQDSYDYQRGFRDVEQQLVNQAQRFNTDAYREELARQAKADTERAFGLQDAARERQMASMGVNPNSGRFQGLSQAQDTQQAAMSAAAMNATRQQARDRGTQMLSGAAGLGRGMQSSLAAYSGALNAGNSAGQNAMMPGQTYAQGLNQGVNTQMQGRQNYMGNMLSMTGQQASIYNNYEDPMGAVLGLGGQLGAAAIGAGMFSDRRLKTNIVAVGSYPNGLPMYEFNYKDDPDGPRYRGVMADEVAEVMPEAVLLDPSGYARVRYDLLGIEMERVA